MKKFTKKTAGVLFGSLFLFIFFSSRLTAQSGAALNLDGTNDYVQMPDPNFGTGNFTVEGWIHPTAAGGHIVTTRTFESGAGGNWFTLAYNSTTLTMELATGGVGYKAMVSNGGITLNAWNHVAVVRSGLQITMYINGILKFTSTQTGIHNLNTGNNIMRFGGWPDYNVAYFTGSIDEMRLWNVARTQCELLTYMNCEISGAAAGLVGNYHFNQGLAAAANATVNTLIDVSVSNRTGTLYNFGLAAASSNWVTPGAVVSGFTTVSTPTVEMDVTGNGNPINDGSTSSSVINHTDFNGFGTRTFVISNTIAGGTLYTVPYLTGTNASQFSITVVSSTSLAGIGSSSLVVAFLPTSAGTKTAIVNITSSDCSEPVYDFVITATTSPGEALQFDGVNDYIETNANIAELAQADFAIEAWVKTTGVSQAILTCANANTSWEAGEKCLYLDATGIPRFVGFGNGYIPGNIAVNDGNWHHVAVTWDYLSGTSGIAKMYVDGVDHTGSVSYNAAQVNLGTFKIGQQNYNNYTPEAPNNFMGLMDEVRIWNRSLCLPEIIHNMNCELPNPGTQPGLNGYYRFNNGTAFGLNTGVTTATDNAVFSNSGTLTNFALAGQTSNWVAPGAVTSGSSCSVYLDAEINLMGNGTTISDGDIIPALTDNTDFGATCANTPIIRTFSIQNTGTAPLTVSSITMSGAGATSFSVGTLSPASPIASGSSATFAVTFTPASSGVKIATINITNNDCSEALYNVALTGTVNALPTVTAATSNSVICNSFTTSLSGSGANTYTWTGTIPATNGVAFSPSVTTTYTVTGTNTLTGCTSTNMAVQSITVNALPSVTISVVSNSICAGNTATLSATGADTYTWNPGALTGASITPSPASTTTFVAFGTNTLTGCTSTNSAAQTITVITLPTVIAATPNATICATSPATLTASGANTYTWSPGALTGATVNPSPSATTTYTLAGRNLAGCLSSNTSTLLITVNPLPAVSIIPLISVICSGGTASLVASGANSYTWNPGGVTTTTISPSLFTTTTYTLIGRTLAGCSSTNLATQNVTVNARPTVTATSSNSLICNSGTTSLIGTGADSYTWNPSITNATTFSPVVTTSYTLSGTYTLTGCTSTNVSVQTISVNPSPTISLLVTNPTVCAGSSPTLTASNAATYTWNPGNFNTAVISPTPASTTVYTVSGTSAAGCLSSNTLTQTITVNSLPVVTASASAASVCAGYSTSLTGDGAVTYTWTGGILNATSFTPAVTASYTVTGTDVNLCENSASITVTVEPVPTVIANITSTSVCEGTSLTLSGSGASTYTWSGGITDNQAFTPAVNNSYTLTGTSPAGCTSTNAAVVSVTVNNLPTVTANVSNSVICAGNLSALSGSGAVTYTWTNGVLNNTAFSPALTNTYTVTGEDASGCLNTATASIVVFNLPVLVGSTSNSIICAGETVTLAVGGANTYSWNTGDNSSTIVTSLTGTTDFTVVGTDLNGCSDTLIFNQNVNICTSLNSLNDKNLQFGIYPNPNNGTFIIETAVETEVTILNTVGQIVMTKRLAVGKNKIELTQTANGVYFIQTKTANFKIIKQ